MKYVILATEDDTHIRRYVECLSINHMTLCKNILDAYAYDTEQQAITALQLLNSSYRAEANYSYTIMEYAEPEKAMETVFVGRISCVTVNDDHSTSTKTRIVVADDESKCKSAIAKVQQEMLDELKKEYPSLKYLYSNTWTANPEVSKSFDFEVTIEQGEKV